MFHKMGTFTGSARKVSPPMPTYMTDDQKSSYLSGLRNNKPTRPTGSRPPPFKSSTYNAGTASHGPFARSDSAPLLQTNASQGMCNDIQTEHSCISKSSSFTAAVSQKSRPLVNASHNYAPSVRGRKVSPTAVVQHRESLPEDYRDSTTRKLEKEEAQTLRDALYIIDKRAEDKAVFDAAQMEAADLVWKHRNPEAAVEEQRAPYYNPDLHGRKSYGTELPRHRHENSRVASDSSTSSNGTRTTKRKSGARDGTLSDALKELQIASKERSNAIIAAAKSERRRSSGQRIISNGSRKGLFRNPEDQIYEEPGLLDDDTNSLIHSDLPLKRISRNSLPRGSRPLPEKPGDIETPCINRVEIYKNPPTQSRNAAYLANSPDPVVREDAIHELDTPASGSKLEIRGEDIRAATTMKKKDRSPKLPTPVAVSDQPGRPIVSFDRSWRPTNDSLRNSHDSPRPVIKFTESSRTGKDLEKTSSRPLPLMNEPINSAPAVPTISLLEDDADIPAINVGDDGGPIISISAPVEHTGDKQTAIPLLRPLPKHSATTPTQLPSTKTSRLPWLNGGTAATPTVSCSSCALPISGRIVTASGSSDSTKTLRARFHPECFTCNHCSTPLECVSFYPEPDNRRAERLESEGIPSGSPEANMDIRFYCHLDFHELFSPRCRSCKTPIEGQVIVAAGGEFHVGHFFCAECGDPFDSETPFVEHNNYAYCVRCHTKRTSARCKGCKQQILDELTIEALGGKWHERCFCCVECGGGFGDEGRFFVRDVEVEPTEKERRKGISRKMEEMAVCQGCEEMRLKA